MELQFEKKQIPCLRSVVRQVQTQEQTQEVRLTEGMPDIGRVLSCWAQVLVRGKEWRSGGMNVSGGVMAWVLYAPEDGSEPRCLDAWMPFQVKWDFPDSEPDGTILAMPKLRSVDARSTSARKVMVRANIGVLGEAMTPAEAVVYEPRELPEDVCVLKNTYPMCLPAEAGEKAFSMEETLHIPDSMPAPARLLRYELRPEVTEQRLLSDKLIFRGTAIAHLLYADAEGQLHSWDGEVPFSQYAELTRDYNDEATATVCMAVTNLEMEQDAVGGLSLKAGLTGQYTVYDCNHIQIVEDAYSPVREVMPQISELTLPAVLDRISDTVNAEQPTENDGDQLLDVAFYPEHPRTYHDEQQMVAELSGTFQMLCRDPEGRLYTQSNRWEDIWSAPAAPNVKANAMLIPTGSYRPGVTGANAQLRLDVDTVAEKGISMVTGLELGEVQNPDPDRPSLILCKVGKDTLWDVAKRTGSTVEAIQKANDLQQEPDGDRILLVPVL